MTPRDKLQSTLIAALAFLNANRDDYLSRIEDDGNPVEDSLLCEAEVSSLVDQLQNNPERTIQVASSGGLFRCASSEHPLATLFAVESLDFDLEGCTPDNLAVPTAAISHESPAGALVNAEPVHAGVFYTLEDWSDENE